MKSKSKYPMHESLIVYMLLVISAGMMGAYTFTMRGGIFCNAQTANVVLMAIALGQGKWQQGLYFILPMSAYLFGAIISELLLQSLNKEKHIKWTTYLVGVQIFILLGVGFIPLAWPDQIVQIIINLIASMQFTAFKKANGIPMSTTFVTNHIRQIGVSIATSLHQKTTKPLKRGFMHLSMIVCFFAGGILLAASTDFLQEKAIWLCLLPLSIAMSLLLLGDMNYVTMADAKIQKMEAKAAKQEEKLNAENIENDNKVDVNSKTAEAPVDCIFADIKELEERENIAKMEIAKKNKEEAEKNMSSNNDSDIKNI